MLYHVANFLCLFCGITLFALGSFGILSVPRTDLTLLTLLLEPTGFSTYADQAYLMILALLGFWLTLRIHVRVPAALALGLILGKLIILDETRLFGISASVTLSLVTFAALLRLVTTGLRNRRDQTGDHLHFL